jgi:hypothetical protein
MAYKRIGKLPVGESHESGTADIHINNGGMYADLVNAYKDQPQGISDYLKQFAKKAPEYARSIASDIPKALASGVTSFLDVPSNITQGAFNALGLKHAPPVPTFRKGIESVAGKEALEPSSESGKNLKEFADTVGSLMFPIPALGGVKAAKVIKGSLLGQGGKALSKAYGYSEETGEKLKTALQLGYNLFGEKWFKGRGAEGLNTLKKELPESHKFGADLVENKIKEIRKDFLNVGSTKAESKPLMDSLLADLETSIHKGKSSYPLLKAWKEDMPEHIFQMQKTGSKRAARYMTDLVKTIDKTIETSPEIPANLRNLYRDSNQLYSHAMAYEKIRDYIKDAAGTKVGKFIANPVTLAISGMVAPQYVIPTLLKAGVGITGATAAHTLYGVATKPGVRKALVRIFADASKQLAPDVIRRHLKDLDSEVSKSVSQIQSQNQSQKKYKRIGKLSIA